MNKSKAYLPLMSGDLESPSTDPTSSCEHDSNGYDNTLTKRRRFVPKRDVVYLTIILVQAVLLLLVVLRQSILSNHDCQLSETSQCRASGALGDSHLQLYSPANEVLEDQIKVFSDGVIQKSIYQEYSDEGDRAWEDLYNRTTMKIPKSEAALLPNRTWPIKEAPGYYIAQLDVFHQLHCVNKLRQALRRDRYDQLLEDPELEFGADHLSHCVDSIRQYVMCHSDPSVVFWQWDPKHLKVKPRFEYPHMCKNFEKIHAWADERHIDDYIDIKAYVEDDLPPPSIIY